MTLFFLPFSNAFCLFPFGRNFHLLQLSVLGSPLALRLMTANVYMEILLFVGHGPFNLQLIFTIPADNNDHLLEADASTFICSVLDKSHLGADHHF